MTGRESGPGPGHTSETPVVVAVLSSLEQNQKLELDTKPPHHPVTRVHRVSDNETNAAPPGTLGECSPSAWVDWSMWPTTARSSASMQTNTCRGLNRSAQAQLYTCRRVRVLEWRTGAKGESLSRMSHYDVGQNMQKSITATAVQVLMLVCGMSRFDDPFSVCASEESMLR